MKISLVCLMAYCFATSFTTTMAEEFSGKVIGVSDGDTITVLLDKDGAKTPIKIRLAEIDAPESKQEFGTQAKKHLSDKVFGKTVKIEYAEKDRYGRVVGKVILDNRYINQEMVTEGFAWHYKQYSKDQLIASAQDLAKTAKSGLWVDPNPTPPWAYRQGKKTASNQTAVDSPEEAVQTTTAPTREFWLNTSSGVRHNSECKQFRKTKSGRPSTSTEGKACGTCGG